MPDQIQFSNTLERVKSYLSTTDLQSNGGYLNPERSNRFIRKMIEGRTILRDIRTITMGSPTKKIDKIGIGSRVLHGAVLTGDRTLSDTKFVVPETSQIELSTKTAMAVLDIPYEVLEDNIEQGNLQDTLLELLADRAGADAEVFVQYADTSIDSGTDDFLCLADGVFKRATTHVVDATNTAFNKRIVNKCVKALPVQYLSNKGAYKMYVPQSVEADYRVIRSDRQTPLGDTAETSWQPLSVVGFQLNPVYSMTDNTKAIFTDPKNIIFGIQRNFMMEMQRLPLQQMIRFVLTIRMDVQIEETDAIVVVKNIGEDTALI